MFRRFLALLFIFSFLTQPLWADPMTNERSLIVLLDTSGSMKGSSLERAKEILIQAVQRPKSFIDIYTFAEQMKHIDTNSSDKKQIIDAIRSIEAGSRTSLFDSLDYLIPIAEANSSDILVISDGGDSQSKKSLEQLLGKINSSGVKIDFLAEFINPKHLEDAQAIISSSGGDVVAVFPNQIATPTTSPPQPQERVQASTWPLPLSLGYALLTLLLSIRFISYRRARKEKEALKSLIDGNRAPEKSPEVNSLRITRSIEWARNRLQQSRRISEFDSELSRALTMIASSLAAGLSILQALKAFAEDGDGVCAEEFRRALGEIQLGIPIERALESVADRMKSEDLRWAVSALAIQREVGGSLSAILKTTAETIESRFELRREVRTLSAEGRISSYILIALPIFVFLFLIIMRPSYVAFFITNAIGNAVLFFVILSLVLAWLWMRKLVRIEI